MSDEDTQHFLSMLDAAVERTFEAYAERMVSESSTVGVLPSKQTLQHSPSLLRDKELTTKLSPQINISPTSNPSSFHSEPEISRKRRRFCEPLPSFQLPVATNQINLGLSEKNSSVKRDIHFVSWPQNFTFQSDEVNKSVQGSETKQPSFFVKNHRELPRNLPFRIGMNSNSTSLFALDGNNVGSDRFKAIEDAFSRIESLIPSLQKLVKTDQTSEQKSVDDLGLPNFSSLANPLGKEKGLVASGSDGFDNDEMSWNSCNSSGSTTQQSGSPSSLSGSYESSGSDGYDSDESEPMHEKVGHSTRMKQPEFTDSTASGYYDTSSYSNSRDDYSDAKSSSQVSSAWLHKWNPQKERGKMRGRLRRLGRKLGMIFHHHHHHHHHHYRDEPDARHARSFWKQLGQMFHHTEDANHRQKLKSEKPRKSEVKTLAKRKQPGHFHALVSGLMKHTKHSEKPKQVKNGFKGIGSGRHGGKKKGKRLLWWPKIHGGRGRLKVPNKGKVRLGNYRTKSFAAAKMILKK